MNRNILNVVRNVNMQMAAWAMNLQATLQNPSNYHLMQTLIQSDWLESTSPFPLVNNRSKSRSDRSFLRRNRRRTRRKRRENTPNRVLVRALVPNRDLGLDLDPHRMVKKGKQCPPCRKIHHAELSLISKQAISHISLLKIFN